LPGFDEFYKQPRTTKELLRFFSKLQLKFKPGTQFVYSGTGYNLLGAIIEQVSGKSYGDYLAEEFFKPLGMKSTFAPHEFLAQVRKHHPLVAQGYNGDAEDINMSVAFAEASIISTTRDLDIWMQALFAGKCISSSSLEKMITPYFEANKDEGVGYGIFINSEDPANPIYSQSGRINGFESLVLYQPQQEISVILLSNEMDGATFELAEPLFQEISKG